MHDPGHNVDVLPFLVITFDPVTVGPSVTDGLTPIHISSPVHDQEVGTIRPFVVHSLKVYIDVLCPREMSHHVSSLDSSLVFLLVRNHWG